MSESTIEVLLTVQFPPACVTLWEEISPRLKITYLPARKPEDIPEEVWRQTEILYTDTLLPQPELVPRLRWIQMHYAGVDFALDQPVIRQPDVTITTLSGAAAPQMAEYVVMMLLGLGHRMTDLIANREKMDWPRDRWERFAPRELRDSTVGLVGYGSIARETARLLQPFGVTILAAKRDAMHPQDDGYIIEGLGDPHGDYFHRLYPIQAVGSMLKNCDFVVVSLPLTPETRGMFNAEMLKNLKPGAFLVDIGRGGIFDQAALLNALQEKRIAAAALDVFAEEPLPANSPFWRLPNVMVTPHVAGISSQYKERAAQLFAVNLRRFLNDESLLNRFDPQMNY